MTGIAVVVLAAFSGVAIPGAGAAPADWAPSGIAESGFRHDVGSWGSLRDGVFSQQVWVASSGETVWVLDPGSRVLLEFDGRGERVGVPGSTTEARRSTGDGRSLSVKTTRMVAVGLRERARYELPSQLARPELLRDGVFLLAAYRSGIWLVSATTQEAWRLEGKAWKGPWSIGSSPAAAAALADGRLVLNLPGHANHAFAVLGTDGRIGLRFGGRLVPAERSVSAVDNGWALGNHVSGDIIAAHRHLPLFRRYATDGRLVWERTTTIPPLAQIEEARHAAEIESAGKRCFKHVLFATQVSGLADGRVLVHYAHESALEAFADSGEWQHSIPIARASGEPWTTAGLAVVTDRLILAEKSGLVEYNAHGRFSSVSVRVEGEDGAPVLAAAIEISQESGIGTKATTGPDGMFRVVGLDGGSVGTVKVSAAGYLPFARTGELLSMVSSPLVLARAPLFCVRVTNAQSGEPIERFLMNVIQAEATSGSVSLASSPPGEVANPQGRGCVASAWRPPVSVRIKAQGYSTAERSIPTEEETTIALEPEGRLAVHLSDPQGQPATGVRVLVVPAKDDRTGGYAVADDRAGLSTDDGTVGFFGLEPGRYVLVVKDRRYLFAGREVTVERGDNSVDLKLRRGARLLVTVVAATGAPVGGASVQATAQGQATGPLRCTTEDSGACEITGLPPGSFEVAGTASGQSVGRAHCVVRPEDEQVQATLKLASGVRLTGTVLGIESQQVTALRVVANAAGQVPLGAALGSGGTFAIDDVQPGPVAVSVVTPRGVRLLMERIEIPSDSESYDIVLRLPTTVTIQGRITRGPAGCGACDIAILRDGIGGGAGFSTATGPDGSYSLQVQGSGSYLATVRDRESLGRAQRLLQVEGDTTADFSLGETTVAGFVRQGPSKAGVGGARVMAIDPPAAMPAAETSTDENGRFYLRGLAPGQYRISATHGGSAGSSDVEVADAMGEVEILLPDSGGLSLSLFDAETGLPVRLAVARVISATGETAGPVTIEGDERGVFQLPSFASPSVTVVIMAQGYAIKTLRGLVPSPDPVRVPVLRGKGVPVFVSQEVGAPCSLEFLDARGQSIALTPAGPLGPAPFTVRSALVRGVEPGQYEVVLSTCAGQRLSRQLVLTPNAPGEVQF